MMIISSFIDFTRFQSIVSKEKLVQKFTKCFDWHHVARIGGGATFHVGEWMQR